MGCLIWVSAVCVCPIKRKLFLYRLDLVFATFQEFQAHKKQSTGLLGRVSDSIQNFGASYMMKNRTPEFTIMYEYIQTFGEKLASIDRITQRVVKEQSGRFAG